MPLAAAVQTRRPHVAVVRAGAFGGWTALHLRRRGHDVTLLDAYGPAVLQRAHAHRFTLTRRHENV